MQDHKCRMPPATTSANPQLVSSSSEDPSSFDNETGCMKGIFQLFDRHHSFSSRRYGSKRITTENGVGQPLAASCDTPRYHQDNVSPYCTFQANVVEQAAFLNNSKQLNPAGEYREDHHHWSSACDGKSLAKSSADPTLNNKPRLDQGPEENKTPRLSFYFRKPSPTGTPTQASVNGRQTEQNVPRVSSSMDNEDMACSSFCREKPQIVTEGPINRAALESLDMEGVSSGLPSLKILPRSRSISGRDKSQGQLSPVDPRIRSRAYIERFAGRRDVMELPSSASRGSDVKDPRLSIENNFTNPRRSFEGNEVPRLTVDLEEGPRLSGFKEDQSISLDGDDTPLPVVLDKNSHFRKQACVLGSDFRDTMRVVDFKDSLQATQKGRDRHRYSVDGTRDPPQVSTCAPRLSADGRDVTQRQKAELQAKTSEGMQRGLSVVARLMGLEEIPSPSPSLQNVQHIKPPSREAKLIQGLLQYTPPRLATEPAPRQSGKYASLQEKGGRPMKNQGEDCQEPMPRPKLALSPKHLLMDGMPHIFRQQVPRDASNNCHPNVTKHFMEESTPTMPTDTNPSPGPEPLHGNMAHRLRQLRLRNLVQERKTLKHILEALQLKGLLHAPRHKQTAGTNFFSDSKLLLVPKGAVTFRTLDQLDHQYQDSSNIGVAGVTMETKKQDHQPEGLNTARTSNGNETLADNTMMIRAINAKPPVRSQESNPQPPLPPQPSELDCLTSTSGGFERLAVVGSPATSNDGGMMKGTSCKVGGQGRRLRLQPKGEIVSSPKTPRSAQVGNIKLLASPGVREPGSPGLPRPGSPNGVAFGSGSKRMPENVRSPQAKSMPHSQLSQELVKGRTAGIIGPESPRLRRPILSDSKSTNSTVEEYPKYQSLKGPVDVSILKSKQLSKLAKEREKCSEILKPTSEFGSRTLLPRRLSFGTDSSSLVKDLVPDETLVDGTGNKFLDETRIDNFQVMQAGVDSKEGEIDLQEVHKRVQSMDFDAMDRSQCIGLPMKGNDGGGLSSSAPSPSGTQHCSFGVAGDFCMGLEDREPALVWREKGPSGAVTSDGVLFEKSNFSKNDQMNSGPEQPSPVSVLDSTAFEDDECSLSSRAEEHTIQDALNALENVRRWSSAKSLKLVTVDSEETGVPTEVIAYQEALTGNDGHEAVLPETTDYLKRLQPEIHLPSEIKIGPNSASMVPNSTSLENQEAEWEFVQNLLVTSGLTRDGSPTTWSIHMQGHIIDPALLVQSKRLQWEEKTKDRLYTFQQWCNTNEEQRRGSVDHHLLFDTVNEILVRKCQLESLYTQPWVTPSRIFKLIQEKSKGENLVREVWEELQGTTCTSLNDGGDNIQSILQKDLGCNNGHEWSDYGLMHGELGLELEQLIFKDLVDETVRELKCCSSSGDGACSRNSLPFRKEATARRQLHFTN